MRIFNMTLLTFHLFNQTLNNQNNQNNIRPYPITIKPIYNNETSIHIPLEENLKKNHLRRNYLLKVN
jgi:hypothetical protein